MPRSPRTLVPAVVAILTLAVAGCGGSDGGGGDAAASSQPSLNATDAAFASSMRPHHEGGVQLRRFVREFKGGAIGSPAINQRNTMDMKALEQASGKSFDTVWLDVISGHHAAAIQMAQIEARGGRSPEAKRLARSIVSSQSAELQQFNEIVGRRKSG